MAFPVWPFWLDGLVLNVPSTQQKKDEAAFSAAFLQLFFSTNLPVLTLQPWACMEGMQKFTEQQNQPYTPTHGSPISSPLLNMARASYNESTCLY